MRIKFALGGAVLAAAASFHAAAQDVVRPGPHAPETAFEAPRVRLHAEYRFTRNSALGAALDGFDISVDVSQKNWNGGFDYSYWGPQIYLTARF